MDYDPKKNSARYKAIWILIGRHRDEYNEILAEVRKENGVVIKSKAKLTPELRAVIDEYYKKGYSQLAIRDLLQRKYQVRVSISTVNRYINGVSFKEEK